MLRDFETHFEIDGELVELSRVDSGHIHDTYRAWYRGPGGSFSLLHQRLNANVFRNLEAVMANLQRITRHLARKLEEEGVEDAERRALSLVPTREGGGLYIDAKGAPW